MAYDVMNSNTARLGETLSVQSPEDIESFAHVLHAAHPDVDKLMCKNGSKIVAKGEDPVPIHGKEYKKGEELGRDCMGIPKNESDWLGMEVSPGLIFAVSADSHGKWPKIGKTAEWNIDGGGTIDTNWASSEEEREQYMRKKFPTNWKEPGDRLSKPRWWRSVKMKARQLWLKEHPTWWEEKRREAEVDASSQVAEEMTDMNLDNKAIVA